MGGRGFLYVSAVLAKNPSKADNNTKIRGKGKHSSMAKPDAHEDS